MTVASMKGEHKHVRANVNVPAGLVVPDLGHTQLGGAELLANPEPRGEPGHGHLVEVILKVRIRGADVCLMRFTELLPGGSKR
jgi:hypothetical protein